MDHVATAPPHPGIFATVESLLGRPSMRLVVIAATIAIAAFGAAPHLHEAIWQDEAATILNHVGLGVLHPFLHYNSPNNHKGFSAMLVAWVRLFPHGVDVENLRFLPFALFLSSIPIAYEASRRLGGNVAATLASALFATSAVATNFATQLRGYGPSWPFVSLALLSALGLCGDRHRRRWAIAYAGSCLCAIAILPTNVYACEVIGVAAAVGLLGLRVRHDAPSRQRAAWLVLIPPLCVAAAYALVWRQLVAMSQVGFSAWTRGEVASAWLRATLADTPWFLPLLGGSLAVVLLRTLRRAPATPAPEQRLLVAGLLGLGLFAAMLAMPTAPFPRTLVPFLPVWYAALAAIACSGLSALGRWPRAWQPFVLGALVAAAPLALGRGPAACRGDAGNGGKFDYDLCHQYFRDNYRPEDVIAIWAGIGRPEVPIVSDFEGYLALSILNAPVRVFEYRHVPATVRQPPMIVAHGDADVREMTGLLGLDALQYHQAADTGYFKVYYPSR
jgi:hypothetical protein